MLMFLCRESTFVFQDNEWWIPYCNKFYTCPLMTISGRFHYYNSSREWCVSIQQLQVAAFTSGWFQTRYQGCKQQMNHVKKSMCRKQIYVQSLPYFLSLISHSYIIASLLTNMCIYHTSSSYNQYLYDIYCNGLSIKKKSIVIHFNN